MGGVGPGLSPGPWSFEVLYDRVIYIYIARQLCARGFITHSHGFYILHMTATWSVEGVTGFGNSLGFHA
jgi:hypothetical protein